MDRYWLLTWTTYGSRLQGDPRGSVARLHRSDRPRLARQNLYGTPQDEAQPYVESLAKQRMRGPAIRFVVEHARRAMADIQRTSAVRGWQLLAVAIMRDHVHLVVGVPGDPEPATLLRDFKAYCSRALTAEFGRPRAGTWWTESGSRRVLRSELSVVAAVRYVADQVDPLLIWVASDYDGDR